MGNKTKAQELREAADKLWNESIGQIPRDSPFASRGIAKVQGIYDEANRLDAEGKENDYGRGGK